MTLFAFLALLYADLTIGRNISYLFYLSWHKLEDKLLLYLYLVIGLRINSNRELLLNIKEVIERRPELQDEN